MKKHWKKLIAWLLILTMVLGSNAITTFAADEIDGGIQSIDGGNSTLEEVEMQDVSDEEPDESEETEQYLTESKEEDSEELPPVDSTENTSEEDAETVIEDALGAEEETTEDDSSGTEGEMPSEQFYDTSEEAPEDVSESVQAPSEVPAEVDVVTSTEEETISTFDKGYVRLVAGTVVYSDDSCDNQETILGTVDVEAIVYGEAAVTNGGSIEIYKVLFDAEDGLHYEGYVKKSFVTPLDEEGSNAFLSTLSGNRQYKGFFIPVIKFSTRAKGLKDGLWVYEVVDNYAKILGYLDYEASSLSVPDQLGGYYVNAIGDKAFANNTALRSMYIHGNVISIADNAFSSKSVTLSGYNGTEVLRYAEQQKMPSENRTDIEGSVFQDHVLDFTYADSSRYEYEDEFTIRMNAAEAANLKEGSIFYIPKEYDHVMRIYKVDSLENHGDYVLIHISEAELEEAFVHVDVSEELFPNWSEAVYEDYVEVVEEKFSGKHDLHDKIVVNYSKVLGEKLTKDDKKLAKIKLEGSAEIGVTGSISYDVSVMPWSFNSFDFQVDLDGQASGGIKIGADTDDVLKTKVEKTRNGYFKTGDLSKIEKAQYDLLLLTVPLSGRQAKTKVSVGVYLRVAISGEVKLVTKLHGSLIKISYRKESGWSKSHNIQWNPLSISAAVDFDFGIAAIAEADCFGIGKIMDIDAFVGLNITAEANMDILWPLAAEHTTEGDAGGTGAVFDNMLICADAKIRGKLEVTLDTDITWFKEVIDKNTEWKYGRSKGFTLFEFVGLINKHWHLECKVRDIFSGGWKVVDECTNSFVSVNFYTGTGETLKTLRTRPNYPLGIKNEPTTIADPDRKYVLQKSIGDLEGWYVYEGCSGPTEYANGVGSKKKWDFENDLVKGNMTLYAEWRGGTNYKVIYKPNFTSSDPAKPVPADIIQEALEGSMLTNPGQMKRDEYRFKGWFRDQNATDEWDFSTDTVTKDGTTNNELILYAGWEYEAGYDPNKVDTDTHGNRSFNGHSYTHVADYKSYAQAEKDAKDRGGYLCTINSAEEQAFLAKYLYDDCAQEYLWLGMTSNDGWSHWKTGETVTYENWESTPSASGTDYNAVIRRATGKWTTKSNTETAHYVIEWGTPATDPNYKKDVKSELTFAPNGDGKTATVTGIESGLFVVKSVISIPSVSPNGLTVTGIADAAFDGNTKLETISIPNTVTRIGNSAFENCTKLKSIRIPDSVTTLGTKVFKGCTSLENVTWSSALTQIPDYTFDGCTNLVSVYGIGGVTGIGQYSFRNNTSMNSFTFPDKLINIGQYAFYGDSSLREIVLPDTLTNVNGYAFYDCTSAYKISLPDNVNSIGYSAFYNCRSASDIYLPKNIAKNSIGSNAFYNVNGTFHVTVPSGAEEWAKSNSKTYEDLGAKQKIKFSAGEGPAYEPTSRDGEMLTEIYVEAGKRVTEPAIEREGMVIESWYLEPEFITKWDFATDKVPEHSITLFAKWVNASDAFSYNIVGGTARISGFSGSTEQVLIPDQINGYTVTGIEADAFTGSEIREIVIPASVTSIASGSFDCANLEKITLRSDKYFSVHDDGVLYLKSGKQLIYAPQGIRYHDYNVPETVTSIRNYAFRGHNELDKIYIPDSVTAIGDNTFERNHSVTLYGALDNCAAKTYAEKFLLPYNMYVINYMYDGGALYSATHQAGTLIKDYFEPMTDFFSYGGWYKDAEFSEEWNFDVDLMPQTDINMFLKWDTLFDIAVVGDNINITGYRGTATTIVIPEEIGGKTVVGIDSGAFVNSGAKTFQVPDCVTTIEDAAFPASGTIISSADSPARAYAINNGLNYKNLTYKISFMVDGGSEVEDISLVPGKTTTLPTPIRSNYYFYGWYTDTSFMDSVKWTEETVMPANDVTLYACWRPATTSVANDLAYHLLDDGTIEITGYSGTKTVLYVPETINGYTVTRIGDNTFESNDTVEVISLPKTVSSIGRYAFSGSAIRTVKGADALKDIEEGAFRSATSLISIALGTSLRNIGDFAFQECSGLTNIALPAGTLSVGYRAFQGCEYLDTVDIPSTLSDIGKEAFADCPRLLKATVPDVLSGTAKDAFDSRVAISYTDSAGIRFKEFEISGNTITASWNKVQNASSYAIESKRSTNKTYQQKISTTDTSTSFELGAYGITYDVKAVALDSNGEVIAETPPETAYLSRIATPSIASVVQVNQSSAMMELNGVTGVQGYEVERAYSEFDEFTLLKSVASTSFRNTGLMKGFDYYYRVRAYTEDTEGERTYSRYSDVYHFHMPFKYVTAPLNVTVRQTSVNAAKISWDPVEDADGYFVYRSIGSGSYKQLRQTSDTYTTNTALPSGGTFSYKVVAYYIDNGQQTCSKESEAVTLTVQDVATPEITEIKQSTQTGVSLAWTAVKGASGYKLYKSTSSDGGFAWVKNITDQTSTTYSSGMISGNTYYYAVRAFVNNEDGSISLGNYSPAVSINFSEVAQAGGLAVSQTAGNKAKLTWTGLSGVDGYEVWMSAANNGHYELAATTESRTASIEGLNDGVTYFFKIRGFISSEEGKVFGLFSEEVSDIIFGTPVLNVTEQNGSASAQLYWSKVSSADGYEIWRKTGTEDYKLAKTVAVNSVTMYGLTSGSSYNFKVRPYKKDGLISKEYGYYSNVKSVYILGSTKITSVVRSGGSAVTIKWDQAKGATGYNLYRSDTLKGIYRKIKTTTERTISNTGLTKGNAYYYKIVPYRTVNGVNVEGPSTEPMGIRLLEKPVITSIEQTAAKALTLTWGEVPKATSYKVYRSDSETGGFTFLKKVTGTNMATSVSLTQNKWYYYTVEACIDEDGTTYYSQQSVAAGAYVTSLAKPKVTSLVQNSTTSIAVTWDKVSGANGYELLRATSEAGPYNSVKVVTTNTCSDSSLQQGKTYYYKVRPYKNVNSKKAFGMSSDAAGAYMVAAAKIKILERTASNRVDLYWDAINGATGYNVYRCGTPNGTYSLLKTTTDTMAYNTALSLDTEYYYRVAAIVKNGSVNSIGPRSTAVGITLKNIGSTSITYARQTDSATVELSWKAVNNADGYELWMANEGNQTFSRVKSQTGTTTKTSLNLVDGKTFRYKVRAYVMEDDKKYYGPYSSPVSVTLMAAPVFEALYQTANNRVEMTWTGSAGATGFEVYRRVGDGTYSKVKDATELTAYNTGLTTGTEYSYKIRAYRSEGGYVSCSAYSEELSITPIMYETGTYPESEHNYANSMNQSWSYTIEGAQAIRATFVADTEFESGFDKLYITDKDGNTVGNSYWTGTQLAGKTIIVPGDTINLRMTSDGSVTKYGFAFEAITPAGH